MEIDELPAEWTKTTIGEIVNFEYGKGLKKTIRDQSGEVPVYGSNGIVGKHSKALVDKPCLIIGRKGTAGAVHISKVPCWAIDTTYYIIPPENINLPFLYYLFSNANLSSLDKSTAIPGLNRNDAYKVEIPLPPLPVQERIVAKIEELFTQLEAGTEALKRVRLGLKRYKASVLKAAVEGRLFDDGKELRRTDDELPEGWKWVKWGDLFSLAQNGFGRRHSDSGTPTIVLRLADIDDRDISLNDVRRIGATEDEIDKYQLTNNDMICIRVNGSLEKIGRMILFRHANEPITFCDHFIRYRLIEPEMAPFFTLYFDTDRARKFIEYNRVSSAGQNTISQGTLRNFEVPLPQLEAQKKIVEEVERRLSVAAAVESVLVAAERRAGRLRQAVLKSAFEGRLV